MTWPPPAAALGESVDVLGVGEAMLLIQAPPPLTLVEAEHALLDVAGAELTVCATVARFGGHARFLSRVGADPAGERVAREVRALGVDGDLLVTDPRWPTGLFLRETPEDGDRRVFYYRDGSAAAQMDRSDAARVSATDLPRAVVLSGLTAALGPGLRALMKELADRASSEGSAVVLDANLRAQLPGLRHAVATLQRLLPLTDLLVLGEEEAMALFGSAEPGDVMRAARNAGVGEAVLKAGERGSWIAVDGELVHQPSMAARVVDSVGAGDAYLGGYLAARLSGCEAAAAARLGSVVAAGVVAAPGDTAGLPSSAEACALLADLLPTASPS